MGFMQCSFRDYLQAGGRLILKRSNINYVILCIDPLGFNHLIQHMDLKNNTSYTEAYH